MGKNKNSFISWPEQFYTSGDFTEGKTTYILKHRNTDVAEFRTSIHSKDIRYFKLIDEKLSPVNIELSDKQKALSFNGWIINRCIPDARERDSVIRLFNEYKTLNLRKIMLTGYGLSLSDHYWIDRKPYNKKWEDINFYENKYSEVIGNILFDENHKLAGKRKYNSPDITTGGMLNKKWEYNKKENKSFLIKSGSRIFMQEPFNEYYAHLLLDDLKIKHTPYFIRKENKEWVSVCECISNNEIEMISAHDLVRKYGIERSYEGLIKFGEENNCIGLKDSLNEMIVIDYIIRNTDRHWNNFGILRNGVSGDWIGLIPLYDNGYSLWNNDVVRNDSPTHSSSFKDTNEECLKYLNINDYVKKIPDMIGIFKIAFKDHENIERKKQLEEGVKSKQKILEKQLIKE